MQEQGRNVGGDSFKFTPKIRILVFIMSRKKREWYPGAVYHVMSRGNRRGALYKDDEDYITFLMHVDRVRERYPFKVHACCLMTNHFHIFDFLSIH